MALPRGLPSETKQGPEDRRGQFNEGTSPGGGGSAQSLERGRAAWGRPEVQLACPNPGWGAQGTTPYLPSHLPLSLLLGKPTGGQHAEQAEKGAWRGSGKAPLERAAPPRHPLSPLITWVSLPRVPLCGAGGFADGSSGWFRENCGACGTPSCPHTRRGRCSCSIRGISFPCGQPWRVCSRSSRPGPGCLRWACSLGWRLISCHRAAPWDGAGSPSMCLRPRVGRARAEGAAGGQEGPRRFPG